MKNAKNICLSIVIIIMLASITIFPARFLPSVIRAINTWFLYVVPPLFPFFVLSRLLTESGIVKPLAAPIGKAGNVLFNAPKNSGYIILLSLLCGYPLGSKLISDNYGKAFDTDDSYKLLTVANTCSPIFIFGTVAAFLHSGKLALIVFCCHVAGCMLNAAFFRSFFLKTQQMQLPKLKQQPTQSLGEIMKEAINSILGVGGWIVMFGLGIEILCSLPPLNLIKNQTALGLICGMLEMTNGISLLTAAATKRVATILCCTILSFGGLCVIFQQYSFVGKCRIKLGLLLLIKIIQAAISCILCYLVCICLSIP